MIMNYFDDIDRMFLTVTLTMVVTYIVYTISVYLKNPQVLAGLIAGLIISHMHIPKHYFDISSCGGLGDIGIALFMMLLGSQFDIKQLLKRKTDIFIPVLSIIIPFILGFLFAPILIKYDIEKYVNPEDTTIFCIFIGLMFSMTAFAVMSMFISQTEIMGSKIGNLAILCGSIDEFLFWVLLGIVLIFYQESETLSHYAMYGAIAYVIITLFACPYLMRLIIPKITSDRGMMGFMIFGCFLSAVISDIVNLHVVFGAFLFGLMLPPDNRHIRNAKYQLQNLVALVLLPIYFVKAGMYTNLHFFFNTQVLILGISVTLLATFGKFAGAFVTGTAMGYSKTESILLGSLLNIRGVIEIMVINIGLELHIISVSVYSILVIMTLVSNFMATALSLRIHQFIQRRIRKAENRGQKKLYP